MLNSISNFNKADINTFNNSTVRAAASPAAITSPTVTESPVMKSGSAFNQSRPAGMAPGGLARSLDLNSMMMMSKLDSFTPVKVDATISDSWEEFKDLKPVKDGVFNTVDIPSGLISDVPATLTGADVGFTIYSQIGFENSDIKVNLTYYTPPSRQEHVETIFDAQRGDKLTADSYGAASIFTSVKNLEMMKNQVASGSGFFALEITGSQPPDAKVAMLGMELFGASQPFNRTIPTGLSINSNQPEDSSGVASLQYRLIELGFLNKSDISGIDATNQPYNYAGTFGPKTETALKTFQNAAGIEPTGVTDAATAQALSIIGLKEGDKGPLVGTLQTFLRTHSNISSEVIERAKDENGVPVFTREMEQSVKAIQRRNSQFTEVNGEITPHIYRVLFNPGLPLPGTGPINSDI